MLRVLLLCCTCVNYSQSFNGLQVDYIFKVSTEAGEEIQFPFTLIEDEKSSLFEINNYDETTKGSAIIVAKVDAPGMFFDKTENIFYYQGSIYGKAFYIKDDTAYKSLNWQLENESKTILGIVCKKATVTFRGRKYVAFYSDEIIVSGGPFKFRGLPGLIMHVYSDDFYYEYLATNIQQRNVDYIANPYLHIKSTGFQSFKDYKTQQLEAQKELKLK